MFSVTAVYIDNSKNAAWQCNFKQCPFILFIIVPATSYIYLSGGSEYSASENRIDEPNWALHEHEKVPQSIKSLLAELPSDAWGQGKGIIPCQNV